MTDRQGARPIRVAVIADNDSAPQFGIDALDAITGCESVTLFSCRNTRLRRRPLRHGAYYALNLLAIRNRLTRMVPLASSRKAIARVVPFDSEPDGQWQKLPRDIVEQLVGGGFDVIVKLGMGLMRVPPDDELAVPILSYHHGDPSAYRGRPAGFWEMLEGAPVIGQVVQRLGNRLDAGEILAFAETRVHPHSYRRTLLEAYAHSPLLIDAAIANALSGGKVERARTGRNYRLPSNLAVLRLWLKMTAALVRRLAYGAFVEKRWRVALAPCAPAEVEALATTGALPPAGSWRSIEPAPQYSFYADPFFSDEPPGILVEALSRRRGIGEIVLVDEAGHHQLSSGAGHLSYPATLSHGGEQLVIPEAANWSAAHFHRIENGALAPVAPVRVAGNVRIVDPTPFVHDGRIYLFGNRKDLGANLLCLWSAADPGDEFTEHPASPLLISPRGGRMAGGLLRLGERLFRFGQDHSRGYGDGVIAFEILELGPAAYRERPLGPVRFRHCRGPHTLNWKSGELLFDWYRDSFAPLAAFRRLAALRSKR